MMRAMFSAIAGLQNHIAFMDVVGNNIANVNTTGYKSARITFQDMLSQTLTGASAPTADLGGTNPVQIGLGMRIGGIDVLHTQGSLQTTGKLTDFAIQGSGMFVLRNGLETFYTRDGAFDISSDGELVNPTNGMKVQGWVADASGAIDTSLPLAAIEIPFGQTIGAQESSMATFKGNLDASLAAGETVSNTIEIYDTLGDAHSVTVTFTKNAAANTWDVSAASTDPDVTGVTAAPAQLVFNSSGAITTPAPPAPLVLTTSLAAASGASTPIATDLNVTGLTQFAATGQFSTTFNNGFSAGGLTSFSVGPKGDITGIFSNGTTRALGQIAMALFSNPSGLIRASSNMFQPTANSGEALVGTPADGGRGTVGTGVLEGSNTDLAREFTNVVIAQRGFQASSRIITSADEMLQDLVNLKR